MEKIIIVTAILGVLVLGILGGVDPSIPSSVQASEPDPFLDALHWE